MASKIKVDQIEGSTGSTITIPTGQTFTVTDGIPVASGGTGLASFTAGDILYATGATTLTKLNKGTAEQVLAMNSGASAPDWGSVDLTVLPTITVAKGGTNLSSFTEGDILYATGATTLAKLAKGSGEDTLKMNSGATAPEWVTVAAASSDFVRLSTVTASAASTVSFDGFFSATYHWYKIIFHGYPSADTQMQMRFRRSDADVTVSNYEWLGAGGEAHDGGSSNNTQSAKDFTGDYMRPASFNSLQGGTANGQYGFNGHVDIYNPLSTTTNPTCNGFWSYKSSNTSGQMMFNFMGALENDQTAISGFTFYPTSGTVTGKWCLYGIKA